MSTGRLFTIGFAKKSAEDFFNKLRGAGIKTVLDVRLNNVSQLAGFTKKDDLRFFLREIFNCDYKHMPLLAPTQEILDDYRKGRIDWPTYESQFKNLIQTRRIENIAERDLLSQACLLCSEPAADRCHRRLVAEYLQRRWGDLEIIHL